MNIILKKEFIPKKYLVCLKNDCSCADKCLRYMAYVQLSLSERSLYVVNPSLCNADAECAYFQDSTPVSFARGFTQMQKRMYPDQYRKFREVLIGCGSHNPYYKRRRGEILLSPRQQKIITNAARSAGVNEEFKFDSYEDMFNWYI